MKTTIMIIAAMTTVLFSAELDCGFPTKMKCGYTDSKGSNDTTNHIAINGKIAFKTPQVLVVFYYNPGTDSSADGIYRTKFMLVSEQLYAGTPHVLDSLTAVKCQEYGSFLRSGYCMSYHRDMPSTLDDAKEFIFTATENLGLKIGCVESKGCEVRYSDK